MSLVLNRNLSKLGVNSRPIFCMFFIGMIVVCISGFVSMILCRWRCPAMRDWLYVLLAGVTYAVSYFSVFYALKVETATRVTVLITSEIVWAFLWQVIFIRMPPFWTSYIVAILILTACIGITLKNKPRPPQSRDSRVFSLRGVEQSDNTITVLTLTYAPNVVCSGVLGPSK
ncbi:hypothetical protein HOLleu_04343 [Holothuria leucospilota]|uniref:EamA domain-containing protein n=1 Tax=Holothuria leucospilota TaxID=206669 RepID=A0A9Q1HMB7_HOLLE|nr:hypothetical protein HOLleu_04343 [Holothuria leucospilota]